MDGKNRAAGIVRAGLATLSVLAIPVLSQAGRPPSELLVRRNRLHQPFQSAQTGPRRRKRFLLPALQSLWRFLNGQRFLEQILGYSKIHRQPFRLRFL